MTCHTCKHSTGWSYTPTGRLREKAGKCTWKPVALPIAGCLTTTFQRSAVWPRWHPDCPTYEQGEPQQ